MTKSKRARKKKPTIRKAAVRRHSTDAADADLLIARKIQAAMIPRRLPLVDGLEMASLYLPCPNPGGDIFDVIQLSEDLLVVLIFEVTGQSMSSTLISALAKVRFLSHIRAVRSPRVVIERVNAEIIRDVSNAFYLTAFVGYFDLHDNKLTYSNAGHINPVFFRSADAAAHPLRPQGTLVGILDNGYYDEQCVYLSPGDWLVLFSDGILSIVGDPNAPETRRALYAMIQKEVGRTTPGRFIESIRAQCELFAENNMQDDDISLIAIEVLTQSRRNQIKEKLGFPSDAPVYLQSLSYFEEMDRATASVLSAMDVFGYPDEVIRKMKISLTELLVNAIHHGNGKDYTKKVFMGYIVDAEKTAISIMDEGGGFNPAQVPDPTLPENLGKDCGRGLYIVRHYIDKIEYNEKGNRILITKYHPYK